MLAIRSAQMAVLAEVERQTFEKRLVEHARQYFPGVCHSLGDELGPTVHEIIRRGQKYGFSTQRQLCKFLNLVFTFGREFDRDPRCQWAIDLLPGNLPGPLKMTRLYAAAMEHEQEARG